MKSTAFALAAAIMAVATPALAETPAAAPAAAPKYSTESSDLGTLIDNPATKAILEKHMPGMTTNPQIEMARPMTLKQLQGFAADMFTDALLAKIDADLVTLK